MIDEDEDDFAARIESIWRDGEEAATKRRDAADETDLGEIAEAAEANAICVDVGTCPPADSDVVITEKADLDANKDVRSDAFMVENARDDIALGGALTVGGKLVQVADGVMGRETGCDEESDRQGELQGQVLGVEHTAKLAADRARAAMAHATSALYAKHNPTSAKSLYLKRKKWFHSRRRRRSRCEGYWLHVASSMGWERLP